MHEGGNAMADDVNSIILGELRRLADAVERLAGPPPAVNDWEAADCFVWSPARQHLQPVARPNRVALTLIRGVDRVRDILHENTVRFAEGFAANNVLLWGARGMGKVVAGEGRSRRCQT
jgi:predicted AAA+ superfamily ATPase